MTALSLSYEWQLVCSVLRRVDLGRIYCSIVQDMKFHWPTQITWKQEAAGKHRYSLVQSNTKGDKYFSCYLFWYLWGKWFIFIKQISKQPFGVSRSSKYLFLKILQNLQENTGVFLISLFLQNETPTQMLSSEFCETFKNIYTRLKT